jgi:hypothetical protein
MIWSTLFQGRKMNSIKRVRKKYVKLKDLSELLRHYNQESIGSLESLKG